nr:immunoglobulin heavy chain junction region [Mus musculus]
CAINWERDYW